jgi:uncharacterized protein (TIGR03067 family)
MASRLSLVALVVGFLLGADSPVEDAAKEAKKLEGTWTAVSATKDGKELGKEKDKEAVFSGDKLTLKGGGKEEKFTYKLDPSQKPKTIDFKSAGDAPKNSAPGKGIYELNGGTLKLCIGPPNRRPTEMSDKGQVLFILKRKK